MSESYIIETAGRTAGYAVKVERTFRFLAARPDFHPLDGMHFATLDRARRSARLLAAALRQSVSPRKTRRR
jgi:hypothetical protein